MILPNTGNMGITYLSLFAYGTQGLGSGMPAIASVIILFHFTLGVFLAKKKFSFDCGYLKVLLFYAIIISVLFLIF